MSRDGVNQLGQHIASMYIATGMCIVLNGLLHVGLRNCRAICCARNPFGLHYLASSMFEEGVRQGWAWFT
ncbi:hypothetical protein P3T22_003165 [Paraburkholderia sp. GAS348]